MSHKRHWGATAFRGSHCLSEARAIAIRFDSPSFSCRRMNQDAKKEEVCKEIKSGRRRRTNEDSACSVTSLVSSSWTFFLLLLSLGVPSVEDGIICGLGVLRPLSLPAVAVFCPSRVPRHLCACARACAHQGTLECSRALATACVHLLLPVPIMWYDERHKSQF